MVMDLKNVQIHNCVTGITAPADARINVDGLVITNTFKAIELRDPPSLLQSLGLPPTTPVPLLIEALQALEGSTANTDQGKIEELRESGLIKWLGVSADLTSIGTVLLSAHSKGLVSTMVQSILG